MAADTPNFYRNEKHPKTQVRELVFQFQITAAKTIVPLPRGLDVLTAFDALTQQQIDDYLTRPFDGYTSSVTTGFTAAQFDATAMGANMFGGIVNMNQQASYLAAARLHVYSGTSPNFSTLAATSVLGTQGLSASTAENGLGLSPMGDIGFRFLSTGLDALTSGIIRVEIDWISK